MPFALPLPHRILSKALAAAALALPLLMPAGVQAREFVSIKGNAVNVREKPSTRSATLWELGRGYPLQVQQRKGRWLQVRDFEEPLGWVCAADQQDAAPRGDGTRRQPARRPRPAA